VTDTFWEIEAINGFPGAYMKYVNEWFSADHFINIMKGEKNRKAKATDSVVYIDANGIKTYTEEFLGEIATQKYQGKKKLKDSTGWDHVFMKDDRYLGEYHGDDENLVSKQNIWEEFSEFIKTK
jgi:XTP/dITP diphosphohydrolase